MENRDNMPKQADTLPQEIENFIKTLPKDKRHQAKTALISIERKYTSPLPPSEEMIAYESICPGTTEKLINAIVSQSVHRTDIESKIVEETLRQSSRGQIFAFALCALLISLSAFLGYCGHDWLGGVFGFFSLAIVASSFLLKKESNVTSNKIK